MTALPSSSAGGDRFVDLHLHSTASDGASEPGTLVETAQRAGLAAIALTDHDTLAGLPIATEAGRELGVEVIAGVELSAMEREQEVHVIGLHLSRLEALDRELAGYRAAREGRARLIVERLNQRGVPVTVEAVLAAAAGGAIGRPHVARALIAGGWVRDLREAFDRWLGYGRPAFVPKPRVSVADAVALVHRAGGLAVLAHPGCDATRERLEALAALGLDAVEVRHPSHTPDDVARIGALVEELGLVPSGGSDWHGLPDPARAIGCMRVPAEWLDRQRARAAERAGEERVA